MVTAGLSELVARAGLEACGVGLLVSDGRGVIWEVNQAAATLLETPREELAGLELEALLPEVRGALLDAVAAPVRLRVCRTEQPLGVMVAALSPDDGNRGWAVLLQPLAPSDSQLQLDELHLARELNRELEAIIESSYDGIWVTDGHGTTLRVNSAYAKLSGIRVEELIGKNVEDLVRQGYFSNSVASCVLRQKKPVTILSRMRSGKAVLKTGTPIFDQQGEIWRVVVNIRDITEMIDLKQQLEQTSELYLRYHEEVKALRQQNLRSDEFIGRSLATCQLLDLAYRLAEVDTTLLVLGETGVGKGAFARAVHKAGPRSQGPFVEVNCGAIPESLLEAELFGYEKGAFTGATKEGKPGMFELANGGTLFLDEIGELPLALQSKLLHAVEERRVRRLGGRKAIDADCRLIAASNRDLAKMAREGKFREDLFYRLNVVPVVIPPLRSRPDDIPPLVLHFLDRYNDRYKRQKRILPRAMDRLVRYAWPGNVRELQNLIERLVVLVAPLEIDVEHLPDYVADSTGAFPQPGGGAVLLRKALAELERRLLERAVREERSLRQAARALGISHTALLRKMEKYGL